VSNDNPFSEVWFKWSTNRKIVAETLMPLPKRLG